MPRPRSRPSAPKLSPVLTSSPSPPVTMRSLYRGISCCASFSNRLYNPDLSIDTEFTRELRGKKCHNPIRGGDALWREATVVPLDGVTLNRHGNMYYVGFEKQYGVLGSDQGLMNSPLTIKIVRSNARDDGAWGKKFAKAIVTMGSIKVLIGSLGEIRKNYQFVN
ncbi:Peroxidase [Parasponia andersonii]|uniref:peroxidase n=1 Tax=Parasponia andersonii TaxID=3476 RepID=A0A2P5D8H4_PARAD|nr:Peroxidase [Parasponia andersonii]